MAQGWVRPVHVERVAAHFPEPGGDSCGDVGPGCVLEAEARVEVVGGVEGVDVAADALLDDGAEVRGVWVEAAEIRVG